MGDDKKPQAEPQASEEGVYGSMERPVGVSASDVRPPVDAAATAPPTGHSIEPAYRCPDYGHAPSPVWYNVSWYRLRAEELGDLAADMMAEGLDGMAYGAARKAGHFGAVANLLYKQRAEELMGDHPDWALQREPPEFLKGLLLALPSSVFLWAVIVYCFMVWSFWK